MYIKRRDENVQLLGSPLFVDVNVSVNLSASANVNANANVNELHDLKDPIYTKFTLPMKLVVTSPLDKRIMMVVERLVTGQSSPSTPRALSFHPLCCTLEIIDCPTWQESSCCGTGYEFVWLLGPWRAMGRDIVPVKWSLPSCTMGMQCFSLAGTIASDSLFACPIMAKIRHGTWA